MDVPILSGGVILLIAAVLWLVYLVPSWQSRHQYNATERNAVRLSQALRILAETSETPGEVHLELDTRTAYEQSKLAKRAEADRLKSERDRVRDAAEHERELARITDTEAREVAKIESEHQRELAKARAVVEKERARLNAQAEKDAVARERAELARQRRESGVAQAKARRTVRLVATVLLVLGLAAAGVGIWLTVSVSLPWLLVASLAPVVAGVWTLQRMSAVAARSRRVAPIEAAMPVEPVRQRQAQPIHDEPAPKWTPRELPKPMTAMAGSSAAGVVDQARAREALKQAAREEAMRQRIEEQEPAPVRITAARTVAAAPTAASPYAAMGVVSDDEIEAHVRQLLARRAAG